MAELPDRLPFEEHPSVETLATIGEDEAVRRRFDARNHGVLKWCFRAFAVAAAIELINGLARHSPDPSGAAVAAANLAFTLAGLVVLRRIQPKAQGPGRAAFVPEALARRVVASFRFWTVAGMALQALFLVLYSAHAGNAEPWLISLAFIFGALCLLPSEALLLHGLLAVLLFAANVGRVNEGGSGGV